MGTLKSYLIGFFLSLLLTLAAYFLVTEKLLSGTPLLIALAGLALAQAIVQLILFLHLGQESKPYWNFTVFLFMVLVITIVVTGTLWILINLNTRTM